MDAWAIVAEYFDWCTVAVVTINFWCDIILAWQLSDSGWQLGLYSIRWYSLVANCTFAHIFIVYCESQSAVFTWSAVTGRRMYQKWSTVRSHRFYVKYALYIKHLGAFIIGPLVPAILWFLERQDIDRNREKFAVSDPHRLQISSSERTTLGDQELALARIDSDNAFIDKMQSMKDRKCFAKALLIHNFFAVGHFCIHAAVFMHGSLTTSMVCSLVLSLGAVLMRSYLTAPSDDPRVFAFRALFSAHSVFCLLYFSLTGDLSLAWIALAAHSLVQPYFVPKDLRLSRCLRAFLDNGEDWNERKRRIQHVMFNWAMAEERRHQSPYVPGRLVTKNLSAVADILALCDVPEEQYDVLGVFWYHLAVKVHWRQYIVDMLVVCITAFFSVFPYIHWTLSVEPHHTLVTPMFGALCCMLLCMIPSVRTMVKFLYYSAALWVVLKCESTTLERVKRLITEYHGALSGQQIMRAVVPQELLPYDLSDHLGQFLREDHLALDKLTLSECKKLKEA